MKQIKTVLCFLAAFITAEAQNDVKLWTLNDCINYALEHNIQVKMSKVHKLSGREDLQLAKAQLFPSLSAGVSQSVVNYPSGNAAANHSYTGNYNVSAGLKLFDGGRRLHAIKQSEIQQDVNDLMVEQSENDIRISLVQAYMQVLYAMEAVKINKNTVEVSHVQRNRGDELLKAGSISKADLAQLESQYSSDKYRLVAAQTGLDNYLLQLKQLLELDVAEQVLINIPELSTEDIMVVLPDKETVCHTALKVMPEVKSSKLNVDRAGLEIKKARAGYYPSLSMSAGIGTGHASGTGIGLNDQIWNRLNESIGLTLSIPIYSNRENKTAVNKAKCASVTSELELIHTRKQLLKTVEGIYLDAASSQNQYLAAAEQVKSVEASYKLIEEQFYLGMKNTLEMLTARNNLLNAQQEMLQSKYMSVMSIQLLNIYQNYPVKHL